jgi:hypothetical protein
VTSAQGARVVDGLTLQIYAELLRCGVETNYRIPPAMLELIPSHLERCADRLVEFPDVTEYVLHPLRTPSGQDFIGRQGVTFYWYPWAMECAIRWIFYAEKHNVPTAEIERVRHVLGHLVVTLGSAQVKKCIDGWIVETAETLISLSNLPLLSLSNQVRGPENK